MSWGTDDLYNQPEKFGLTQIGCLDDPEASYSFDYLIVWKHEDGRVFYAEDSGCSCPSPFEDFTKLEDATEVTDANWAEFQHSVETHCLRKRYNYDTNKYEVDTSCDPLAADRTEILSKVAGILRTNKEPERNATLVGFTVLIENGTPRIAKTYYAEVES